MADEPDYEVEAVRKWRYNMNLERKEFLIKWVGYAEEENTWEPESNLTCPKLVSKFRKTLKKRELQFLDSKFPERLTGLQRNAEIVSMYGRFEQSRPSTSSCQTSSQPRVVIYITFADDEKMPEKVDFEELRKFRPDKAYEFVEQRLIDRAML